MYKNSKYFYGYASVFNNKDWYGDVMMKESLNIVNLNKSFSLLLEHNPRHKIGDIVSVSQNSKGLFVEGYIQSDYAKKHLPLSIGYIVDKFFKAQNGIRYIEKFTLIEVSLVAKSANIQAFGFCEI